PPPPPPPLAAPAPPRVAPQSTTFTASGVMVDVTAPTAAAAQDKAFLEAQVKGFRQLLERLTSPADHARLPQPSPTQIVDMVLDVGVDEQKNSATRYVATMTVRFKPEPVRRLLRDAGIAYAESRQRPFLVLPVMTGPQPVLWDDPNPWRAAWSARPADGLVPFVVPLGELADISTITAAEAVAGAPAKLAAIAARHGVEDVLVALAAPETRDGRTIVKVSLRGYGPSAPVREPMVIEGAGNEKPEMVLGRAVQAVVRGLEDGYKQGNLLQFDRPAVLSTLVRFGALDGWLDVRRRLRQVPQVRRTEVVSLSPVEAALVLHYVGDQTQLQTALAQAGLTLSWAGDFWVMEQIARPAVAGQ
ncbi:MAG: DUF2066 domain-containing protein, partial [Alphaproteobacteria bacterium]|nr:DUF2066 domain-containing protein [Alphaproteobacteria bacterium]